MDEVRVLHIDDFEETPGRIDFYCNDFKSHLNDHLHSIAKSHKHDFFLTVLFTKGYGAHEIDFSTFPIQPGCVFMMYPGQVHSWKFTNDIEGYIFFHSADFFDQHYAGRSVYQFPFFYSSQNKPCLQLTTGQVDKLKCHLEELKEEYRSKESFRTQKLVSLVDLIYLDISRWYLQQPPQAILGSDGYSAKLRQLGRLIDTNFHEHKSAAYYAEKMNMTSKHLNRIVKTTLDQTTSDLILDRIMLEAKRKLVHEAGNLSQIAFSLGYDDYAHFSKLFKARTGFTPKQFRARHR